MIIISGLKYNQMKIVSGYVDLPVSVLALIKVDRDQLSHQILQKAFVPIFIDDIAKKDPSFNPLTDSIRPASPG
jgi:hypothetical protein